MRAEIPVRLRSMDPAHPFDILTRTLIVNAQGCGLHAPNDLPVGVRVELAVEDRVFSGRILNSTPVDPDKGAWVTGVQLDESGNVWNLPNPPADWATVPRFSPTSTPSGVHPFAKPAAAKAAAITPPAPTPVAPAPSAVPATASADTRKRLEALTEEIASHLRARASADWEAWRSQAESALRKLQEELSNDLNARIGDRHSEVQKAIENLSAMIDVAEQRRNELASGTAAATGQGQADEQTLRSTAEQISAQWLRDSEEAMSGLRARVEEMVTRQEAEMAARLAERQNDIVRNVEAGTEKLDRLLAAADRALEQMEGWENRSVTSNAELLRAAESALEQIDQHRAAAEATLKETTAASVDKLNAAVTAGEHQLDTKLQQVSWEYDAQAEAAGQKLEGKLSDALTRLRKSLEEHQAALSAAADTHRGTIAGEVREQLKTDSERHIASLREEAEHQADLLRQGMESHAGKRDTDSQANQQSFAAGMAELAARQEQVAAQIAELQKTKAEIESIAASLPATIVAQAQQQAAAAWEQLRNDSQKMIAETIGAETRRSVATLSDDFASHARTLREQLADQAGQMAGELQSKISASLSDRQEQISSELQAAIAQASREFSEKAQSQAETHRSAAEAVHQSAQRRLEEVAARSEHLLAESEAALYKSAEEIISGEIARARQQVQEFAGAHVESALAGLHNDAARIAGEHSKASQNAADRAEEAAKRLQSLEESAARRTDEIAARQAQLAREMQDEVAKAAGEFSRHVEAESQRYGLEAAARLQQLQSTGDLSSEALRTQIGQAQAWLNERTAEFRQSVHDAFLQAAGEIRGRVHSAVDTVDELIQQKSKQVIAGVESTAAQHSDAITRTAAEARQSIEAAQANAAATAEAELQKRLAETLEHFREDAARLAHSAASRWQAAMEETLRSFPELLKARLDSGS